jgi:hypothetical protein
MAENSNTCSRLTNRTRQKTVSEEKAAYIAMDWMRVFYGIQVGTMETQEFRTRANTTFGFSVFRTRLKEPIERMFFVVLLPSGMVVEPKVAERL